MAGRCRPCHGILASTLPRFHERRAAGLVGTWLRVIGARLRFPVRPDRVARPAVDRDIAGPRRGLDPVLCERARGLGREQAPTAGNEGRGEGAFALHLQTRLIVQYADGLLLDSQHFLRLLFDLGLVLGLPAEGTELDAADGGHLCSGPTSSSLPAIACGASFRTYGDAGRA